MTERSIDRVVVVDAQPGTGILHPFPTVELPHVDPFVFLDTGAPRQLGDAEIYVAPHPHRGVQPVSLVFRASIEHRDSLGTHRTVESGGMQWLVAGAGALHEEVLRGDAEGVFHMAQLWVNVPADQKMATPEHHSVPAADVPVLDALAPGVRVRLFAGDYDGHRGPAPLGTPVFIAHVMLEPSSEIVLDIPTAWTCASMVIDGTADLGTGDLGVGATAIHAPDGDAIRLHSDTGGQVLVMAGEPLNEPIAMGGGFVMNTDQEVRQAFEDYRSGTMGTLTPSR